MAFKNASESPKFSRVWKSLPCCLRAKGFIKTHVNVQELFLPCSGHHVGMKFAERYNDNTLCGDLLFIKDETELEKVILVEWS